MKHFLHKRFFIAAMAALLTFPFVFSSCKKDQTCGLKIFVTDTLAVKQRYMWVVIDIPENTPPSSTGAPPSNVFPIQLNTTTEGFVETSFELPAIVQANVYDSTDYEFVTPVKKKIIKLEPGETITETIEVQ